MICSNIFTILFSCFFEGWGRYSMSLRELVCVSRLVKGCFAFSRGTTRRKEHTHMSSESGAWSLWDDGSLSPSCLYPSSPIVALHVTKKGRSKAHPPPESPRGPISIERTLHSRTSICDFDKRSCFSFCLFWNRGPKKFTIHPHTLSQHTTHSEPRSVRDTIFWAVFGVFNVQSRKSEVFAVQIADYKLQPIVWKLRDRQLFVVVFLAFL